MKKKQNALIVYNKPKIAVGKYNLSALESLLKGPVRLSPLWSKTDSSAPPIGCVTVCLEDEQKDCFLLEGF